MLDNKKDYDPFDVYYCLFPEPRRYPVPENVLEDCS